jgi:hypothetical protein
MPRFKLRTLLILVAIGPPLLAVSLDLPQIVGDYCWLTKGQWIANANTPQREPHPIAVSLYKVLSD